MALSAKDFNKLKRLRAVFDMNYRWWRLVSDLLSYAPAIITEDMVRSLEKDGSRLRASVLGAGAASRGKRRGPHALS